MRMERHQFQQGTSFTNLVPLVLYLILVLVKYLI